MDLLVVREERRGKMEERDGTPGKIYQIQHCT